MATRTKLTYADYMKAPEGDHHRWEIIDGEWARTPFPGAMHQLAVGELMATVSQCLDTQGGSDHCFTYLAVILGPHDIYEPDLIVLTAQQLRETPDDEHPRCVPKLCVEITDETTRSQDRGDKYERYALFGVPEYWIVDHTTQSVETFLLEDAKYRLIACAHNDESVVSFAAPDLDLRVDSLFRVPFAPRKRHDN
ncbi:MAG TPA: Uma2 family endonuclease [Thermomicrobiales bacterium]